MASHKYHKGKKAMMNEDMDEHPEMKKDMSGMKCSMMNEKCKMMDSGEMKVMEKGSPARHRKM